MGASSTAREPCSVIRNRLCHTMFTRHCPYAVGLEKWNHRKRHEMKQWKQRGGVAARTLDALKRASENKGEEMKGVLKTRSVPGQGGKKMGGQRKCGGLESSHTRHFSHGERKDKPPGVQRWRALGLRPGQQRSAGVQPPLGLLPSRFAPWKIEVFGAQRSRS